MSKLNDKSNVDGFLKESAPTSHLAVQDLEYAKNSATTSHLQPSPQRQQDSGASSNDKNDD